MSRREGKGKSRASRPEEAWSAWLKAQRRLLKAWTRNLRVTGIPEGGGGPGAGFSAAPWWQGLPGTGGSPVFGSAGFASPPWAAFMPPFSAFAPPFDFLGAALRQGGAESPDWWGRIFPFPPWQQKELPGVEAIFQHIPGAWLQSLLGMWPVAAEILTQLSRQATGEPDFDDWKKQVEEACRNTEKVCGSYAENMDAFIARLLSLGMPLPRQGEGEEADAAWQAAREWLEQWLSLPVVGPWRVEQEQAHETLRLWFEVLDKARTHNDVLSGMGREAMDALRERLLLLLEEGRSITSLRDGFHLWVECCEQAYRGRVMNDRYSRHYGELVNALFRLRKHTAEQQGRWLESQGWPSRQEMDTVLKAQHDLGARLDTLQEAQDGLHTRLDALRQAGMEQQRCCAELDRSLLQVREQMQDLRVPSREAVPVAIAGSPGAAACLQADPQVQDVLPAARRATGSEGGEAAAGSAPGFWSGGRYD